MLKLHAAIGAWLLLFATQAAVPASFAAVTPVAKSAEIKAALRSKPDKLAATLATLARYIDNLTGQATNDETVIGDLQTRLKAAEVAIAGYASRFADSETRSAGQAKQIAVLEDGVLRLADRLRALKLAQRPAPVPVPPTPASTPAPVPILTPTPAPKSGARADNGFVVTNASGTAQKNYPVRAGLPLVCGEIPRFPQALVNGSLVPTQADVKNRCPDGSARFAVVSFVIPELPASGSLTVVFRDQPGGNNDRLSVDQLRAVITDDVRMELTQPATLTGTMDADSTQATWQTNFLARLKAVTNGSLAFRVDGAAYQVTGINLSAQPSLGYALSVVDAAVKATNLPVRTFGSVDGHVYAFGGKTLSLATPATGTDLGPLLFKTAAASAPQTVTSASLVQMLRDGSCAPWTQGPVAQTMLCRDYSAAARYDLGFGDDGKPIRPMFYATFWPALGKVEVDAVAEIANSQNLRSRYYDVRILTGKDGAMQAYAQKGIAHVAGTRWVRHVWLGGAPEQRVNRKRDIGYLVDTHYLPPYDPTVVVPETVLAERWAAWLTPGVHKRIGDEGWWNTSMPSPGERCEIGWTTCWTKRLLDSGDWRMREIATVQADLFGGFNAYYREGNALKFMDKAKAVRGLGFPVVPYDRPYILGRRHAGAGQYGRPAELCWSPRLVRLPGAVCPQRLEQGCGAPPRSRFRGLSRYREVLLSRRRAVLGGAGHVLGRTRQRLQRPRPRRARLRSGTGARLANARSGQCLGDFTRQRSV